MGVKEDFIGSSLFGKVAIFVLLAANLFNWIAFCTSQWGIQNGVIYWGLWRRCTTGSCSPVDGLPLDWVGAVQAFAIFGFVGINVAFLLVILMMFTSKCKRNGGAGMATVIICFFSAVCYLIAVIVFAIEFALAYVISTIGYSLYLANLAFILALVSGILLLLDMKKGGGTSPA